MSQCLMYNGKPMELHVGNFRTNPTCMSLMGCTQGLFGQKKDVVLVASIGQDTGNGETMRLYQGYLDASNRNYDEIKRMLEDNGIAKPALDSSGCERQKKMGSYMFTLYDFDQQKLSQLDPKGCQIYENSYHRAKVIDAVRSSVNQRMEQTMGKDGSYDFR